MARHSKAAPAQFRVRLQREKQQPWGFLLLGSVGAKEYLIQKVKTWREGAPTAVAQQNVVDPKHRIEPGQAILEVNGCRETLGMQAILLSDSVLCIDLLISREPCEYLQNHARERVWLQQLARLGIYLSGGPCRQAVL